MLKLALHPTDACCSSFGWFAERPSRNKFPEKHRNANSQDAASTRQFMETPLPQYHHIHLPRGEVVVYTTTCPNIRVLAHDIRNLGYDVWVHDVAIPRFQQPQPPLGTVLHAIVLNGVILLFAEHDEGSTTTDSSSAETSDASSEGAYEPYIDTDNVDSDTGKQGRLTYRQARDVGHNDSGP